MISWFFEGAISSMQIISRLFIMSSSGFILAYTIESYPTQIRTTGYGVNSAFGKLSSTFMPSIRNLLEFSKFYSV